ncbi:MAG: hypothetical protein ACYC25_08550, partial [Paludibacter sp.]
MKLSKLQIQKIIPFTILPIAILSVIPYPAERTNLISNFANTTIWWIIESMTLFIFWRAKKYFVEKETFKNMQVVHWYLLWNIFSFLHGILISKIYWDWKDLIGNTLALLMPIVAYGATSKILSQSIFSFFVRYVLPLFFIFVFLIAKGAYGFYLVPISFLILFFPVLTIRGKGIVLIFTLIVLTSDLGARSNVIKFGV